MADEIDKFVLEYKVNLGDSEKRLEQFDATINKVDTSGKRTAKNLENFGNFRRRGTTAAGKEMDDFRKKVERVNKAQKEEQKTAEASDKVKRNLGQKIKDRIRDFTKSNEKAIDTTKEFGRGATEEFAKVVPGVDAVTQAVRAMGAEFAVASLAIGAIAVGIKAVMDMREQYNKQRLQGMEVGVSGLRMEEYQRKFVRNSEGRVSRSVAADEIKRFAGDLYSAYADPSRTGEQARRFRLLGVDVGARGAGVTPVNTALTQLAARFQKMSAADVQGVAKSIGMNQDFALTLRKLGPSIGKVTELTQAEIDQREKAEQNLVKFNDSMAQLTENFKQAENALGEKLLPALTKVVDLAVELSKHIGPAQHKVANTAANASDLATTGVTKALKTIATGGPTNGGLGMAGYIIDWFADWQAESKKKAEEQKAQKAKEEADKKARDDKNRQSNDKNNKAQAEATKTQAQTAKEDKDSRSKTIDQLDDQNRSAQQSASAFSEAINLFNGAVTTFANAIDEKQAWAAWAGEMGFASGLSTSPAAANSATSGNMRKATTLYDSTFDEAAKKFGLEKYGLTGLDLKRQAWVESKLDPNAVSNQGAIGIGQILPSNYKRLGITDPRDPTQSIMGMARMMQENMKKFGDYRTALMAYHGGWDQSAWGPKTRAYPDLVRGAAPSMSDGTRGVSIGSVRLRQVQSNIAGQLGLPADQVMQGLASKGDIAWKLKQMEAGVQNSIYSDESQLGNMLITPRERARLMQNIRQQQIGLSSLQGYGGVAAGIGQDAPQQITIGERAIQINVLGSGNPEQTADAVFGRLHSGIAELSSQTSNGLKN